MQFRSARPSGVAASAARSAVVCGLVWLAALVCGCAAEPAQPVIPVAHGEPLSFAFGTASGDVVTSDTSQGRVTVLLFITTFDLASQAQAKQLEDLYRLHAPRFNAVAVVMEPPKNVELVRSFGAVLGLSYPLAIADDATLSGVGPFGAITSVPSWVVLDRSSRTVFARAGALPPRELEKKLRSAER